MTGYIVGVDLGQASDYTAVIVAAPVLETKINSEIGPQRMYPIPHIERIKLHTRYPEIVAHLADLVSVLRRPVGGVAADGGLLTHFGGRLMTVPPERPDVALVVDYTGVGRPVLDMILEAQFDCDVVPVTITSGNQVRWDAGSVYVPKRDLASTAQRVLQEGRLKIPRAHDFAALLTSELSNFKVKISASGHDSYGASESWREGTGHDDLVLALCLGLWYGESTGEVG